MCGIAGYRVLQSTDARLPEQLQQALAALRHRGPDDCGDWVAEDGTAALGQRRLAILDLTPAGHQPMFSACGRWIMVFNGEVYNYRHIRGDLEALGHAFRGTGDSEVILAAISQWGPAAVERFIGMFAIALWHRPSGAMHLLRDRLGVKPLYYHWDGRSFFFGSELKALRCFKAWRPELDPEALADFLRYGYITDPLSIYRNVRKLPPGHHLVLGASGDVSLSCYWNVTAHLRDLSSRSEDDLTEELEALMTDAFGLRMIADVPVGVFLSGGIDSSVLAAILQKRGGQHIKTFTIGFDLPEFDESQQAAELAAYLGTEHHARTLRVDDAKRLLPAWSELYDEPFADESGVATLMVAQFAAEQVKVVLSADGGDELFSGYSSYEVSLRQWGQIQGIPRPVRSLVGGGLRATQVDALDGVLAAQHGRIARGLHEGVTARLKRIGERIGARGAGDIFDVGVQRFAPDEVARLLRTPAPRSRQAAEDYPGTPGEKLCLWDLHHYLPADVLVKVDRATMAASIEGREPLIDHRLVEFAFSLPFAMRRGSLGSKHLLKKVLFRHVPRTMMDRPKRGFAVPVAQWLRGDLASLVDEHLDETHLRRQGLFDADVVRAYRRRQAAGDRSVDTRIWLLVAFQMWHRRWLGET